MKKRKTIKVITAALCIFLVVALAVLGTLLFPLKGKNTLKFGAQIRNLT